jgi:hypothetical protein
MGEEVLENLQSPFELTFDGCPVTYLLNLGLPSLKPPPDFVTRLPGIISDAYIDGDTDRVFRNLRKAV